MFVTDSPPLHTQAEIATSRQWANLYRQLGYNPVPSRADEKRPHIRWSEWTDRVVPAETFDRFGTANIQVMTGRRWGLVAIDLDGPEAIEQWPLLGPPTRRTWITHSGGGGRHVWFSVPTTGPSIPSGRLWSIWEPDARDGKGDWKKHTAIEILGDRKLVMAPPSIHPVTGRKYKFLAGHSPREIGRPTPAPAWLLNLPILKAPRPDPEPLRLPLHRPPLVVAGDRYDRDDVLAAIWDKTALAASWGLRLATSTPNSAGWIPCHSIHREDRSPSASFHPGHGLYWEHDQRTVDLFGLAVAMGVFHDYRSAIQGIGSGYHARHSVQSF